MSNNALYQLVNEGSPITRTLFVAATLDFPSIAAAGTQALTVSCPGASVGDVVAIGLPATVNAGVLFDARVTATNTLTVRALNITAAAVDPASALYDLVVFKIA